MKYIVTDMGFAIFSDGFTHSRLAQQMEGKVLGAGFIRLRANLEGDILPICDGKSVSLDIKSRGIEDDDFIEEQL